MPVLQGIALGSAWGVLPTARETKSYILRLAGREAICSIFPKKCGAPVAHVCTTCEAEIGRIEVKSQPRQKVLEIPSPK
jgi:hypothetical protein